MIEAFEEVRNRLWGIAYRMLGTPDDADDIVQEAQLRWLQTDRSAVRDAEGWLVAVTTRGADAVARGMIGAFRKAARGSAGRDSAGREHAVTLKLGRVNGEPAMLSYVGRALISVTTFSVRDGRVHRIFSVLNPDKLERVTP